MGRDLMRVLAACTALFLVLIVLLVMGGAPLACLAGVATVVDDANPAAGPPTEPEREKPALRHLVILHTNDIHGQVLPRPATWLKDVDPLPDSGGLPRLAAAIQRERRAAEASGAGVLVVDGGDWFQGTPEGSLDQGRGFLGALAHAGHDALVVGNHEFDHGVAVLTEHLAAAPLPALLANVRDAEGKRLPGTRDSKIVEHLGLSIALVGLLTPLTPQITHASTRALTFEPPAEALTRVKAELGDDVDWILPVCHLGVEHERALALAHPWLDVIVGGHSHTYLRNGVEEGSTLVVQAGDKASVLGRVDVWFDAEDRVVRKVARLVDLYEVPLPELQNQEVEDRCAALAARAADSMDEVIGVLAGPLEQSRRPLVNTSAGNFITDLMRARTNAHVALHNRGGIRTALPAGPVTRRDLFMLLPFANHLVTVELDGATLQELARRSVEGSGEGVEGKPFEFSGMTIQVRTVEGKPRFAGLIVAGEPCEPARRYRMTTNSFLAEGSDGLNELASATPREIDFIVMRDLLELAFAGGTLTPATDQRYEVLP
jgi:5'-nucleotidase/UDP-sugar diphosphatase